MQAIGIVLARPAVGLKGPFRPAAYLMEKLAFKSTNTLLSEDQMQAYLDGIVGSMHARSNRQSILLAGLTQNDRESAGQIVRLLGQILQDPRRVSPTEVEEMQAAAQYEIAEMSGKPDEQLIPELVQSTALLGAEGLGGDAESLLGLPKHLSTDPGAIQELTEAVLADPARNVHLVGSGMAIGHEGLVELAQQSGFDRIVGKQYFGNSDSLGGYRGGEGYYEGLFDPNQSLGLCNHTELCHLAIAFKAPPSNHPDAYAVAVLQMLLGGGGSFSAGGPGKGMYSRLYTQLLNRHHWLEHARAFSTTTMMGGCGFSLFGLHGSADPGRARELAGCLVDQLRRMPTCLTDAEVSRAKRQVQSAVLMGVESRMVELEDLVDQLVVIQGNNQQSTYVSPQQIFDRVEAVGVADLERVAKGLLCRSHPPTVVAYGPSLKRMPTFSQISAMINKD